MTKRKSIPYIALLIAFALWMYIKPEKESPALSEHHPSYIADKVASNHYDQFGFNDYRIFSEKMTSYPGKEVTFFEGPKVIVYIKDKETDVVTVWQLTSLNGALKEKHTLVLTGEVLIENLSEDQLVQKMLTDEATVLLDSKEVTTDSKVTWSGPQIQQEGVGMWISMNTEEMTLKSHTKAVYLNEPK